MDTSRYRTRPTAAGDRVVAYTQSIPHSVIGVQSTLSAAVLARSRLAQYTS